MRQFLQPAIFRIGNKPQKPPAILWSRGDKPKHKIPGMKELYVYDANDQDLRTQPAKSNQLKSQFKISVNHLCTGRKWSNKLSNLAKINAFGVNFHRNYQLP